MELPENYLFFYFHWSTIFKTASKCQNMKRCVSYLFFSFPQDGRASNISIVSTESSELGSPTPNNPGPSGVNPNDPYLDQGVPDLPAKIRDRNGVPMPGDFLPRLDEGSYDMRSRGGEASPLPGLGNEPPTDYPPGKNKSSKFNL